jgi:hypothetical protein
VYIVLCLIGTIEPITTEGMLNETANAPGELAEGQGVDLLVLAEVPDAEEPVLPHRGALVAHGVGGQPPEPMLPVARGKGRGVHVSPVSGRQLHDGAPQGRHQELAPVRVAPQAPHTARQRARRVVVRRDRKGRRLAQVLVEHLDGRTRLCVCVCVCPREHTRKPQGTSSSPHRALY